MLKSPFCCKGGHYFEAFLDKVIRDFYLCTEAQVDILPSFDVFKIHPQLGLGEEDEFCALPCTVLAPKVGEAVE